MIGCNYNNSTDNYSENEMIDEDSINKIREVIKEALDQGTHTYKVNENVSERIYLEHGLDYEECLKDEGIKEFINKKFGIPDSLKEIIKERGDFLSSQFIKVEKPLIVYGTDFQYNTIFSIYSPEIVGTSYVNEEYQFGVCRSFSQLDSVKLAHIKKRFHDEFINQISKQCSGNSRDTVPDGRQESE